MSSDPRNLIRPSDHEQEILRHGQAMLAIRAEAMDRAKEILGKGAGLIKLGALQLTLAHEIAAQRGYSSFDSDLIREAADLRWKLQDANQGRH